jgi:heptosyltransferase-2
MSRALVIAPQWIGDAVMSQPLMARLAAQQQRITVAALPWVAPVYRAMPEVAEVMALPFQHGRLDWAARRELGRQWRGRFDAAYVLPNSIKSALLPWLAGVPRRVGYHGEGRWVLLNERLPNPGGRPPMVAFYSALAGGAAAAHGAAERPRLVVDATRIVQAAAQAELEPGRYWVFAPGAEYGPAKRWPVAHYAALARSLHQRGEPGGRGDAPPDEALPIALLGSGKEAALCEQVAALAPQSCRVLAGQTSLDEAIALIAGARGMVSNDSGLMHVAAAFGVPQVAVFGSTSPEHTPPHSPRATVLWLKDELKLDCMPCFERECRYGHLRCLQEVAPARVEAALRQQAG